jgi:hypothetical protein
MLRLASLTSALLLTLMLVGCVSQGDEGMTVINNTAVSGDTCTLSGGEDQPFKSHGQIYALSPIGYTLTPLISSRVTLGTEVNADPLQKTIFLRGADVTLTLKAISVETGGQFTVTQKDTVVEQFGVLFAGSLPPSGSVNVAFEVIPPATLRSILGMAGAPSTSGVTAEVVASVVVRGDLGGDEVKSNTFEYPISVCTDCVINVTGNCPAAGTPRTGDACNMFQDGIVDCCVAPDNTLTCPASTM